MTGFECIQISHFVECFQVELSFKQAFSLPRHDWWEVSGVFLLGIFSTNMHRPCLSQCGLIEFGRVQSSWFSACSVTDGNKIALTVIKTLEWAGLVNGLHYPAVTSHLNKHVWCFNQSGFWFNQLICSTVNIQYTWGKHSRDLKCKGWLDTVYLVVNLTITCTSTTECFSDSFHGFVSIVYQLTIV